MRRPRFLNTWVSTRMIPILKERHASFDPKITIKKSSVLVSAGNLWHREALRLPRSEWSIICASLGKVQNKMKKIILVYCCFYLIWKRHEMTMCWGSSTPQIWSLSLQEASPGASAAAWLFNTCHWLKAAGSEFVSLRSSAILPLPP